MRIQPIELPANAENPHTPNADEWWQESVVLGWADIEKKIGGFIRIGHQPNRGFTKCCFGVVSYDGPGYTRSAQDLPYRPQDRTTNSFRTDDFLSAEFDGQTSRWRAADEHCDFDLQVRDVHAPYDFFSLAGRTEVSRTITPNHIQAGGTFTGTVRIGETRHTVQGFTYRDHSWGTRLLHNPNADFYAAWWFGGSFGPDFSFGFGDGRAHSGSNMPFNYIVKDGVTYNVTVEDATVTQTFADAMSNTAARIVVSTEELGQMVFEAEGYGNVVLEMEQKHFELSMPATIRCGDRVGGGIVDTIFNPRNGTTRPFFLVGAALENGLNEFRRGRIVRA